MARKTYSDEFREATAIYVKEARAGGMAWRALERELKIPRRTIMRWVDSDNGVLVGDNGAPLKRQDLVERLTGMAHLILDNIEQTVSEAEFRHLMVGLGITVDKIELMSGRATERIDVNELSVRVNIYVPDNGRN